MNAEVKVINLLIIEKNKELGESLLTFFQGKNINVVMTHTAGSSITQLLKENHFDMILVGMPLDGTDIATLVERISQSKKHKATPFILLSSKNTKQDIINGLDLGADDYITKPYDMEEIFARIKTILRRCTISGRLFKESDEDLLDFALGEYVLNTKMQTLSYKKTKEKRKLTNKENLVLKFLCQNLNKNIDRRDMLVRIWRSDSYQSSRSMDVYIVKIRKYLKNDPNIILINNHSIGYKLVVK